ncbi:MFS transporter [Nocardia rhamnosiphila]
MEALQSVPGPGKARRILATLFLGTFIMGSTELIVVGVLNLIAADMRLSVSAVGTLVTAYALGLAIGGPILTALTIRLNRRVVLIGTLALFIAGNLTTALTTNYDLMLVSRTVTGALQGQFIASAFAVGVAVVPPERAGRAMATVISGVAVSAAIGVPLGTLLGHVFNWRDSMIGIVVLTVLTLFATLGLVPSVPSSSGSTTEQAAYAFAPRVLSVLVLCFLTFGSLYAGLTYLIPFLTDVTGVSGALISAFLLLYGVAAAVGSFGGGRFADQNAGRTLIVATVGAVISWLVLYFLGTNAWLVAPALLFLGIFAMGMAPSLQYRVVDLAGPGGPLAHSLPASAINLGIAVGSFAGGVAVGEFTSSAAVLTALIIAALAIPVAWGTSYLTWPSVDRDVESAPVAERVSQP